ncbi:MAG: DEAD/DEAH box helicase, partial [Acidobacteriota bacterium]|nr:DEAD/DEAH box helicase [Acidobacteriota bacterium]
SADALWELVWAGLVTNDTFHPLRALLTKRDNEKQRTSHEYLPPGSPGFLQRLRQRRGSEGASLGRWSLVEQRVMTGEGAAALISAAEWSAATAQQMLVRNGIVMRETAAAENVPGGYAAIYPALKTMEENGWVRRGMFVASMGAAQFATSAAVDMLRSLRRPAERNETIHLAASDPANPYGSLLPWLENSSEHNMARAAGASVVLANGKLVAFLRRRNPAIRVFLPDEEPERSQAARDLAKKMAEIGIRRQARRSGLLIETIDDTRAGEHFLGRFLEESGFVLTASGYQLRRMALATLIAETPGPEEEKEDEFEESA